MKHLNNYLDFFEILKEQKGEKIYNFDAKDPYEYKVEDDNWLARQKKKKGEWNNITGDKFKEAYLDSIKKLDDKFPNARSKDAPKRKESNQTKEEKPAQAQGQKKAQGQKEEEKPVQTQAKEEETKEVSYKRDNGETATGTVVGVNKDDKTVTIKTDSGKEFEKPFDKVEMSGDELNKMADAKPAETQGKKEQEKPNYSVKIRFVESDWEAQIFNNGRLIDTQKFDGKNFNEKSIKKQLEEIGKSSGFIEYDPADKPGQGRSMVGGGVPQPDFSIDNKKGGEEKPKDDKPEPGTGEVGNEIKGVATFGISQKLKGELTFETEFNFDGKPMKLSSIIKNEIAKREKKSEDGTSRREPGPVTDPLTLKYTNVFIPLNTVDEETGEKAKNNFDMLGQGIQAALKKVGLECDRVVKGIGDLNLQIIGKKDNWTKIEDGKSEKGKTEEKKGDNPPQGLEGFFLADQKAKDYISGQGSLLAKEGETYCYPFPPKGEYVYISGDFKNPKGKTMYFGTKKEQQEIDGNDPDEIKDGIQMANDMKKEMEASKPEDKPKTDQEARAKSKAADDAEDKLTTSKSGSKVSK